MSDLYELRCKECGKSWGNSPRSFCEECFSPLEVSFDYDSLKKKVRREDLAGRAFNMWRYAEFLPLHDGKAPRGDVGDRKSTRLNSSHTVISYAVFCLKKKKCNAAIFFQGFAPQVPHPRKYSADVTLFPQTTGL